MGKSIRSKIKKRLRTAKRQRVDAMLVTPQTQEHHESLKRVIEGRSVRLLKPKNAFKYPDAEGAVFAQHEVMKPIDFRSSHMPMAGFAFRGNRRKYEGEQADFMANLAKSSHPKMEVMGGGGAIVAKTGARVSKHEAEVLATAAVRPEVAAVAEAGPARASSAVAAAVAEDAAAAAVEQAAPASGDDDIGKADADHLRRPLVKDTTKAQRQRPRANAVKKKTKAKAPESSAPAAAPAKASDAAASSPSAPAAAADASAATAAAAGKKTKKAKGKEAESAAMETD